MRDSLASVYRAATIYQGLYAPEQQISETWSCPGKSGSLGQGTANLLRKGPGQYFHASHATHLCHWSAKAAPDDM